MKMPSRKQFSIFIVFLFLGLSILPFQNCGKMESSVGTTSSSSKNGSRVVGLAPPPGFTGCLVTTNAFGITAVHTNLSGQLAVYATVNGSETQIFSGSRPAIGTAQPVNWALNNGAAVIVVEVTEQPPTVRLVARASTSATPVEMVFSCN